MSNLIPLLASSAPRLAPYLVGLILGFLAGCLGHLIKAPLLIVFGIALVGLTSAVFVIAADPSLS